MDGSTTYCIGISNMRKIANNSFCENLHNKKIGNKTKEY